MVYTMLGQYLVFAILVAVVSIISTIFQLITGEMLGASIKAETNVKRVAFQVVIMVSGGGVLYAVIKIAEGIFGQSICG